MVRGSAEVQASLQVNGSPSSAAFQAEVLENSDKRGDEAPAATKVHVCFTLLLITVKQAAKPLRLQPLHQSKAYVLQRAAGTEDGLCCSPCSALAAR